MIVAKPRFTTLFSFSVFLLLSAFVLVLNVQVLLDEPKVTWYRLLIILLLAPICLYLLYRIFFQYKKISVGKKKINIHYPLRGKQQNFAIREIESWKEESVKTGKNSYYKELVIQFGSGQSLKMGMQEYTEYKKILSYLNEHAGKKRM